MQPLLQQRVDLEAAESHRTFWVQGFRQSPFHLLAPGAGVGGAAPLQARRPHAVPCVWISWCVFAFPPESDLDDQRARAGGGRQGLP